MRWVGIPPKSSWLLRWAKSLAYRALAALVVLGLVWGIWQAGGQPARLLGKALDYLLTKNYDLKAVATDFAEYLSKPGLDVKVMGPLEKSEKTASLPDLPVTGSLARGFGWQQDNVGWPRFYQGIELKVKRGAPVKAVLSGRVTRVMEDKALGKVVVIEHSQELGSLYGRLGEVGVKAGQEVVQGQMIGTVEGEYFHFELRRGDRLVDPILELQPDKQ
ncbi:MAG: peptidoglycan DD-metalloendopeptidase family protein [Thermacetogeniaceae bacterium]